MGSTSSGAFLSDLNGGRLPAFSFITPNMCNDTHDCSVSTGDAWLQGWVPKIIASPLYKAGQLALFITWDEDDGSSTNRVATIVVTPYTPVGWTSATAFTHYSGCPPLEQFRLSKECSRGRSLHSLRARRVVCIGLEPPLLNDRADGGMLDW
jgi:hypothetical protein